MKCTNCGFNAENDPVCPICGQQLAQNKPQPPKPAEINPYQNAQALTQNPYTQPQPKRKKTNPGVIVLITIVSVVIVIGIVLAVLSGVMYNSFGNVSERSGSANSSIFDFGEKIDVSDITTRKLGETFELNDRSTVTLAKIEKSNEPASLDGYTDYKLTVEIKNTSDAEIYPEIISVNIYDTDGYNLAFPTGPEETEKIMFLYYDTDAASFDPITPGETQEQVQYLTVNNDVKKVYVGFSTSNVSLFGNNSEKKYSDYYEFDFSQIKK